MSATLPDSVPHWTHPHEPRRLRPDDVEIAELLTAARAESYLDGRTRDQIHKDGHDDAIDTFRVGDRAEVAVADSLGFNPLAVLDLSASAWGDDGADLVLPNGRQHRIDVKGHESPPTGSPPKLLVEKGKVEKENAEAYVLVQVWGEDHTVIHGWTTRQELISEGRVEGPPDGWNHWNWVMEASELRPIDELRGWVDGTPF